jgi:diacylglycerol kinase family enzyme
MAHSREPTIVAVDSITVQGSFIVASDASTDAKLSLNELVFIAHAPKPDSSQYSYVVCGLKEDDENVTDRPFQVLLLRAKTVPEDLLEQHLLKNLPEHLLPQNDFDVLVSTKSGTGRALEFWRSVLQPLLHLVGDIPLEPRSVVITESDQSVGNYAKSLENGEPDRMRTVVLLSGDGGAVDMLNSSRQFDEGSLAPTMALIPLGTGNALFNSLHKPLETNPGPSALVIALRTLFRGVSAPLPMFKAEFSSGSRIVTFKSEAEEDTAVKEADISRQETSVSHLFGVIVASYGFHASIVYESDTPEYRVHGSKRFGMVAQELLRESHSYAAQVGICRASKGEYEAIPRDTHAYVLSSMVSNLERTFTISPASKPLDGKLHIVHFGPIGGERCMEAMMKAYDGGKHVGLRWEDGEEIGYEEINGLKVHVQEENERWRKVCIDGTIVDIPHGGTMTVTPQKEGRLRVLVDPRVAAAARGE